MLPPVVAAYPGILYPGLVYPSQPLTYQGLAPRTIRAVRMSRARFRPSHL